jgi:hypothetical protein
MSVFAASPLVLLLAGGIAFTAGLTPDMTEAQAPSQPPIVSGAVSALAETRSSEGRIVELFGDRFILESDGQRVLVEPFEPQPAPFAGKLDDRVTVLGVGRGPLLRARRIVAADGRILLDERQAAQASGPDAPGAIPSALAATLERLALSPVGVAVRKKHHTEITARMADGRAVFVGFDRSGRLLEIEDAAYDRERGRHGRPLRPAELQEIARKAGFTPTGEFDEKKHHTELGVRNAAGERLELHIDRAGYIYKQVWLW